jgi:opacity protein-like surface antigen
MKMDIRSIAISGAVLLMSSVAGFAQDWTKSPDDWSKKSQTQAQSPSTPVQTPQPPPQTAQPPVQPQVPQNQTPPAKNWTRPLPPQSQMQNSEDSGDWTQKLYSRVDFGGFFQQNATLDKTTSSGIPPSIFTSGTTTFNFGARGDVALGYNLNKSFAAEFDTGLLWNSADKIGTNTLSSLNQSFDTYTIPVLANLTYKIPMKGPWSSYVGIGVGGAASILVYNLNGSDLSDCNFVFAYQAEAGLRYQLSQNSSLGIAYDFLGTTDPSWNLSQTIGVSTTSYHLKEKGFYTHSITLSFTWDF